MSHRSITEKGYTMGRIRDAVTALTTTATPPTAKRDDGDTPPAILPPSRSDTGGSVTQDQALTLSMVYRAVGIHAVSATQLTIEATRGDRPITKPALLRKPNLNTTFRAFIEQTVVSMACQGDAYWKITRGATKQAVNLEVLNPAFVTIVEDRFHNPIGYSFDGVEYTPDQVKQLSLMRVPGHAHGLGPIQAAQTELRGTIDTRDYASNWFEGTGQPNGVLKSDQNLTKDAADAAKEQWQKTNGGGKGVAVLGAGLTYSPIFLNPEDAQFIENQKFNVTQIARLFGVPASLMLAAVEGGSQTYANVEQDWIGYVRFSLMQYLSEIEDAFTELLPGNTEARFNIDALLRSDTLTRYGAYKIGIESKFLDVTEVRQWERLGKMPTQTTETPTTGEPA